MALSKQELYNFQVTRYTQLSISNSQGTIQTLMLPAWSL